MTVESKSVLLVAPYFFGYYRDIITGLRNRGFQVSFISDRPSEATAAKAVSRLIPSAAASLSSRHFQKILNMVSRERYDIVFFVGGMTFCFDAEKMSLLRSATDAKLVMYLWDSLANCPFRSSILSSFDIVISFDRDDCRKFGVLYAPLFYPVEYARKRIDSDSASEYGACFVGSVHQVAKFRSVVSIVDRLGQLGVRAKTHYYIPSKLLGLVRRMQYPEYRSAPISYSLLSRAETASLFARSDIIIDSPQENQNGLTMRSIEALGTGKKLLTSNQAISEYDFFESGNVMIYDGTISDEKLLAFVRKDYSPYDNDILASYSLDGWINKIMLLSGMESKCA